MRLRLQELHTLEEALWRLASVCLPIMQLGMNFCCRGNVILTAEVVAIFEGLGEDDSVLHLPVSRGAVSTGVTGARFRVVRCFKGWPWLPANFCTSISNGLLILCLRTRPAFATDRPRFTRSPSDHSLMCEPFLFFFRLRPCPANRDAWGYVLTHHGMQSWPHELKRASYDT